MDTAIKMLKKSKAVGIDHIASEMIIASADIMLPICKKLFNAILNTAHYPSLWEKGIMVNLFKSGDPYDTGNYRGLMINSCLGKLFNTVMNNRLDRFLSDRNKFVKSR